MNQDDTKQDFFDEFSPAAQMRSLDESRQFARQIAQLADDRNCRDVVVLEVAAQSPVAKHFLLATGTSSQQVKALASEIEKTGKDQGRQVFGHAGLQQGRWAVIDFVDVVVHLFDDEYRKFYDLELLWGDAPHVEWRRNKE